MIRLLLHQFLVSILLVTQTIIVNLALSLSVGQKITRAELLRQLIFIQYTRNDIESASGRFSVFGNTINVNLPYQKDILRIELFGDEIESLSWVSKHNNTVMRELDNTVIFPARHFVTTQEQKDAALTQHSNRT